MWVSKAVVFNLRCKVEPVEKFKKSWSPAPFQSDDKSLQASVFLKLRKWLQHTPRWGPTELKRKQAYIQVIHRMYLSTDSQAPAPDIWIQYF